MKRNKYSSAIALILTISTIALLTLIVVGLITVIRLDTISSFVTNDRLKAAHLAEAGVRRAIVEIQNDAKSEFVDDLADSWNAGYADAAYWVEEVLIP